MPKDPGYVAGRDLGLPAEGAGSVARFGVRLAAVLVDSAALAVAGLFDERDEAGWIGALIAVVVLVVLPCRWGATLGQAALRLRVVPVDGREPLLDQRGLTVWTALGRALMWLCAPLMFLIAAVTLDDDRRHLVDRWTRTVVLEW
jgi:uncharacterized RDD family membrane protein YckC